MTDIVFFDPYYIFPRSKSKNYGIIREAYIVDLTTFAEKANSNPRWDHIQLAFTGVNGNLPNLDMISYPLEMFPRDLQPESSPAFCSQIFQYMKTLSTGKGNPLLRFTSQYFSKLFLDIDHAVDYSYKEQFCGMMTHLWLLGQGPTGLHGQFLRRNIDSITFKPVQIRNFTRGGGEGRGGAGGVSLEKLLDVVMSVVYVSSNLHGKIFEALYCIDI